MIANEPLKSMKTTIAPINAMPSDSTLNKVQLVAKVAKMVPHPVVQQAAHVADAAVQGVKQVKKATKTKKVKKSLNSTGPSLS